MANLINLGKRNLGALLFGTFLVVAPSCEHIHREGPVITNHQEIPYRFVDGFLVGEKTAIDLRPYIDALKGEWELPTAVREWPREMDFLSSSLSYEESEKKAREIGRWIPTEYDWASLLDYSSGISPPLVLSGKDVWENVTTSLPYWVSKQRETCLTLEGAPTSCAVNHEKIISLDGRRNKSDNPDPQKAFSSQDRRKRARTYFVNEIPIEELHERFPNLPFQLRDYISPLK